MAHTQFSDTPESRKRSQLGIRGGNTKPKIIDTPITELQHRFLRALEDRDEDSVRKLIFDGFDIDQEIEKPGKAYGSNQSPLAIAIHSTGCDSIAALLIRSGAFVPKTWYYRHLLSDAIGMKTFPVTSLLLLDFADWQQVLKTVISEFICTKMA
jgi:hypothetical protein